MSEPLWPHGLQHPRLPCPSPIPEACSNSCLWWCHPTFSFSVILFSSCLQSFPASGFFSSESVLCIRWPKYWSFSFSISPSNEYSGLISFRIDWLDLLAVQGTLKSLLQHHSSKASILWCSAFLMVQLSQKRKLDTKWIRDTKGTFHAKMGTIKDRNGVDLTEQNIWRGGKNTQKNYTKKILMIQIIIMVWSLT